MSVERARELLEEVLQYRDNPQGYLTGTSSSRIEKALRELQPEDWLQEGRDVYVISSGQKVTVYRITAENGVITSGGDFSRTELCPDPLIRCSQPEPKVIDWQRVVDQRLPVEVSMDGGCRFTTMLHSYNGANQTHPFGVATRGWKYATLETDQWVFNSAGENPWPEGVRIEVWLKNGVIWDLSGQELSILKWKHDIIASRAVGLEEDWTYGGEG